MERKHSSNIGLVRRLLKATRADSGLTSAIILIAFVIVASSIAFVILSLGGDFIGSTRETGKKAQEQSESAITQVGSISGWDFWNGSTAGTDSQIDMISFTLQLSATSSGEIDLGSTAIVVKFSTSATSQILTYNVSLNNAPEDNRDNGLEASVYQYGIYEISGNGDLVLEEGEQFEFIVYISGGQLTVSTEFSVEIIPSIGNELSIERTTPTKIDIHNDM